MKTISRYIMTLALLITAVGGAWADEEPQLLTKIFASSSFLTGSQTFDDIATVTFGGTGTIAFNNGWIQNEYNKEATVTVTAVDGYTITSIKLYDVDSNNATISTSPFTAYLNKWGATYVTTGSGGAGDYVGDQVAKIEVYGYKSAPAEPDVEVTTNAAEGETTFTEAWFNMPAFDATAEYELVRDMSIQMTATMGDGTDGLRYRVKKAQQGEGYEPADLNMMQVLALVAVNDGIEQKALTLDQDYYCRIYKLDEQTLQPEGDGVTLFDFDFAPGLYALKAFANVGSNYDGETALSNTFKLFQGYEVEVAAGEFATFYKDEPLYADPESSADAKLYTIQSVSDDKAVLSNAIETAPSLTPLLIFNNSDETKTFLLIPATAEPNIALTVAPEFQGTLTGTTIAASTEGTTNYALNGKQFVFVKNAIEVGPNKAWLSISNSNARSISIVFDDETTGINLTPALSKGEGVFYDLNGRKITAPTKKGIYILNGKKVVVK